MGDQVAAGGLTEVFFTAGDKFCIQGLSRFFYTGDLHLEWQHEARKGIFQFWRWILHSGPCCGPT